MAFHPKSFSMDLLRTRIFSYITTIWFPHLGNLMLVQYYWLVHSSYSSFPIVPIICFIAHEGGNRGIQNLIKDRALHSVWRVNIDRVSSLWFSFLALMVLKSPGQLFCRKFFHLELSDCLLIFTFFVHV